MTKDVIAEGIEKIIYAFLSILILIYFVPAALGAFGIFQCIGCESLTTLFVFTVLPVGAVFIILYFIWQRFSK